MTRDISQVVEKLRTAFADDDAMLRWGADIPVKHCSDWTRLPPVIPLALARPRTTEQVSRLLGLCHETGTPVVPQGGLTGLVGGAHPVEGCVAISMERMSGVEEIDAAAGTMTVLAGTPLEQAQAAADAVGLMFPLDLGARGSCTIGGNVATNAGGNRVIAYGPTRNQVLGLEVVLADGSVLQSMNRLIKDNTGYDLKHLFIGSEGTLGIITRAILSLRPQPATTITALCALPSAEALVPSLAALRSRIGPSLSAFEAMWPDFWQVIVAQAGRKSPFARAHGAYALIEMSGFDCERDEDRLQIALSDMLEAGLLSDVVVAQTSRETGDFWGIREAVGELRSLMGSLISFDVSIPAQSADAFVATAVAALEKRWPDATHLAYGHLGDNNIHIIVRVPSAFDEQPKDLINEIVYDAVARFRGSVSAEHGIGLTKKGFLHLSRSPIEIATMQAVKATLDPRGIMNPGKLFDRRLSREEIP
ncbi:FAD-binding oxidoreductase [Chelatococcus sp.]|nr:FAD-binding oxidoreductase [Chelatococcus sp.]MBS7700168.1 FAD-binding oxidoreductase [Chelatococcus sp. YT9]MBX3556861.1 FAD-binding oxidoreductase [Chelatococcus sp.]